MDQPLHQGYSEAHSKSIRIILSWLVVVDVEAVDAPVEFTSWLRARINAASKYSKSNIHLCFLSCARLLVVDNVEAVDAPMEFASRLTEHVNVASRSSKSTPSPTRRSCSIASNCKALSDGMRSVCGKFSKTGQSPRNTWTQCSASFSYPYSSSNPNFFKISLLHATTWTL